MKSEQQKTDELLYGTKPDPEIEALFILGAREKETLPDVCRRRMHELGREPGTPPVAQDSRIA